MVRKLALLIVGIMVVISVISLAYAQVQVGGGRIGVILEPPTNSSSSSSSSSGGGSTVGDLAPYFKLLNASNWFSDDVTILKESETSPINLNFNFSDGNQGILSYASENIFTTNKDFASLKSLIAIDNVTSYTDNFCNATSCYPLQDFLSGGGSFDNTNIAYRNESNYFTESINIKANTLAKNFKLENVIGLGNTTIYSQCVGDCEIIIPNGGGTLIFPSGTNTFTNTQSFTSNVFIGGGQFTINDYVKHNGDTNTYMGFPSNDAHVVHVGGIDVISSSYSGGSGQVVINEVSQDVDFRVESDSNQKSIFLDSGMNTLLINSTIVSQLILDNKTRLEWCCYGSWGNNGSSGTALQVNPFNVTQAVVGGIFEFVTPQGIVLNPDGSFKVQEVGIYKIDTTYNLEATTGGTVNWNITVNKIQKNFGNPNPFFFVHASTDPIFVSQSFMLELSSNDNVSITADKSPLSLFTRSGSSFTMERIR